MTKKNTYSLIFTVVIVIGLLSFLVVFYSPVGKTSLYRENVPSRANIGAISYHSINHKMSNKEKKDGQQLTNSILSTINHVGYARQLRNSMSPIFWHTFYVEEIVGNFNYVSKINCHIKFVNFKETKNKRYLWLSISRYIWPDNSKTPSGYQDVLTLIVYKRNSNNQWSPVQIKRAFFTE